MADTHLVHKPENRSDAPAPPPIALRTYRMLRLCSVGVIALLAISILIEYKRNSPDCLQDSISAYYFTAVQSVFVGTLLALGLVMIVLWGKTAFEDGVLNLAGIVAPVVAFAPTGKPTNCGLETTSGQAVTTVNQKLAVINSATDAIDNNVLAYLLVIAVIIVILAVVGALAATTMKNKWITISGNPKAFWIPWGLAAILCVFGFYMYLGEDRRDWYYDGAHKAAAITLFVFIVLVVINIGFQKKNGVARYDDIAHETEDERRMRRRWAKAYWALAAVMVLGVPLTALARNAMEHPLFFLEAWMIGWLAVFWLLQTWDRWNDGAPRTPAPTGTTSPADEAQQS
jgi:hypothetical protein